VASLLIVYIAIRPSPCSCAPSRPSSAWARASWWPAWILGSIGLLAIAEEHVEAGVAALVIGSSSASSASAARRVLRCSRASPGRAPGRLSLRPVASR
jgi:hypothetical protein